MIGSVFFTGELAKGTRQNQFFTASTWLNRTSKQVLPLLFPAISHSARIC
jgi:hypothetical protein